MHFKKNESKTGLIPGASVSESAEDTEKGKGKSMCTDFW